MPKLNCCLLIFSLSFAVSFLINKTSFSSPLRFESDLYFGNVFSGEIVCITGTILNRSLNRIYVKSGFASCSCASIQLSPGYINPGERFNVPIRIDTTGVIGSATKYITVLTDKGNVTTSLYGNISSEVANTPSNIRYECISDSSSNTSQNIYISSAQNDFNIVDFKFDYDFLNVDISEPIENHIPKLGDVITIVVKVSLKKDNIHPINNTLTLFTNSPVRKEIKIGIEIIEKELPFARFFPDKWIINCSIKESRKYRILISKDSISDIDLASDIEDFNVIAHKSEKENEIICSFDAHNLIFDDKRKVFTGFVIVSSKSTFKQSKHPILIIGK